MVFGSDGNFTQDNLRAWDMGRRVSNRRAHEHLRAMRTEMDAAGQRWRCLDDDELLRDYVCSRPDAAELVGGGIEQAWGAFLGSVDQNHRLAPHVPVQRFDWVLIREDNTSARIHPSSKSHGVAVHGNLDQWLTPDDWHSAPAAMRGAAVMSGGAGTAFTGRHQCDVIGRNNAQRFLREVPSSTVLVNASTRFSDGFQLGLGAEIGISTTKLHSFGPMGVEDLTTSKFIVYGSGQIRT